MTERKYELLFVDDEQPNLQKLRRTFMNGYVTHTAQSCGDALGILETADIDAIVTDQRMPGMTGLELLGRVRETKPGIVGIVLTGFAEIGDLIDAINTGKVNKYITKPWSPEDLRLVVRDALEKRELARENERLSAELRAANERLRTENAFLRREMEVFPRDIIYGSREMDDILRLLRRVVGTETTVLVQGETGTGKEMVARFIHAESARRDQIFIPVNCGAIPRDLVESEFFGHARGAFTGATAEKKGYFEMAHGGTIFLDEIGEAPQELQVKLLRVIQESEIMPVGYHQPKKVDVRIIASTNRDLRAEVAAGNFRQDLFFRINVFSVTIPPLRERRDDIRPLAEFFLRHFSRKLNREAGRFGDATLRKLYDYSWPGNVRELQNEIERLVLLTENAETIGAELLSDNIRNIGPRNDSTRNAAGDLKTAIKELEDEMIRDAMIRHDGNKSHVARVLGISRQSLLEKLQRVSFG
ncbi:MAG: sigma-54 dependent transcriptional regulator [Acidobacteriota bacterium]|jgi:two-component system response regulator HupR/HoxA|nr:sigma-54 dependent transcriptional regulator [Acidobacteriota bacterium]